MKLESWMRTDQPHDGVMPDHPGNMVTIFDMEIDGSAPRLVGLCVGKFQERQRANADERGIVMDPGMKERPEFATMYGVLVLERMTEMLCLEKMKRNLFFVEARSVRSAPRVLERAAAHLKVNDGSAAVFICDTEDVKVAIMTLMGIRGFRPDFPPGTELDIGILGQPAQKK